MLGFAKGSLRRADYPTPSCFRSSLDPNQPPDLLRRLRVEEKGRRAHGGHLQRGARERGPGHPPPLGLRCSEDVAIALSENGTGRDRKQDESGKSISSIADLANLRWKIWQGRCWRSGPLRSLRGPRPPRPRAPRGRGRRGPARGQSSPGAAGRRAADLRTHGERGSVISTP